MNPKSLIPAGLMVLPLIVYGQALRFEFVNYDDLECITGNPRMAAGLTFDNVAWAFRTDLNNVWQPITWLSFFLDATLFRQPGGTLNAGGFHATSLLFHAANVLLLYYVLRMLTGAMWPSALVAALFAVHPLHVESVAWITERKDVLSQFFGLLALMAYIRWVHKERWWWYAMALAAFLLSLMSKPTLVTLPFLLLLLDWWPLDRWDAPRWMRIAVPESNRTTGEGQPPAASGVHEPGRPITGKSARSRAKSRQKSPGNKSAKIGTSSPNPAVTRRRFSAGRLLLEKFPFFAGTIAMSVIAIVAQGDAVAAIDELSLPTRLANCVIAYVKYLSKAVWPTKLAVFYPQSDTPISRAQVAVAAAILLAVTLGAIAQRRRRPYLLLGWLWFWGTMVPMIGLVQIGKQQMADRYAYFPFIGLYVALSWSLKELSDTLRWGRRAASGISAAMIALLCIAACKQASVWQDSITLFERAIAVTSKNLTAHVNLGNAYQTSGRFVDAIKQYEKALAIDDRNLAAHVNVGVSYATLNQMDKAIAHFQQAVNIEPHNAQAQFALGMALANRGQYDKAVDCYKQAIASNPQSPVYHREMARVLSALQQIPEAIDHLERAVILDPNSMDLRQSAFEAHCTWGATLSTRGRTEEAVAHLRRALELDPKSAEVHNQLGLLLLKQGDRQNAAKHFREAVRLRPDFVEARRNLDRTGAP